MEFDDLEFEHFHCIYPETTLSAERCSIVAGSAQHAFDLYLKVVEAAAIRSFKEIAISDVELTNTAWLMDNAVAQEVPGLLIGAGPWGWAQAMVASAVIRFHQDSRRAVHLVDAHTLGSGANTMAPSSEYNVSAVLDKFEEAGLGNSDDFPLVMMPDFPESGQEVGEIAMLALDARDAEGLSRSLEVLYPKLSLGGYVTIQEFFNSTSCIQAVLEFRRRHAITAAMVPVVDSRRVLRGVWWNKGPSPGRCSPHFPSVAPTGFTTFLREETEPEVSESVAIIYPLETHLVHRRGQPLVIGISLSINLPPHVTSGYCFISLFLDNKRFRQASVGVNRSPSTFNMGDFDLHELKTLTGEVLLDFQNVTLAAEIHVDEFDFHETASRVLQLRPVLDFDRQPIATRFQSRGCAFHALQQACELDPVLFRLLLAGCGTSSDKFSSHSYWRAYRRYLPALREKSNLRLLEIGIAHGGSAKFWTRYFGGSASLHGIDVHRTPQFEQLGLEAQGYNVYLGSQDNSTFLSDVLAQSGGHFDLIIDDGGHWMHQMIASFKYLWHAVVPGGRYVVEDVQCAYDERRGGGTIGTLNTIIELAHKLTHAVLSCRNARVDCRPEIESIEFFEDMIVFTKSHKFNA